jgi:hypothetical protein
MAEDEGKAEEKERKRMNSDKYSGTTFLRRDREDLLCLISD